MIRVSKQQLEKFAHRLSDRDKAILASLQSCRYLTSGQIQRLHCRDHASLRAALNATNLGLKKLKSYGLIKCFDRRIGGVRGGSGANVWSLAEGGIRFLNLNKSDNETRKRFFDPSPAFLEHTLAVSEAYLQITEICHRHGLTLAEVQQEPDCWRSFSGADGKIVSLRPDMFAMTASKDYEDCWFIEMDLATECHTAILEKCRRYADYCKSKAEQQKYTVFPLVVWIVPSAVRKENIQQTIAGSRELPYKNIFTVILPDELEALLTQETENSTDGGGNSV